MSAAALRLAAAALVGVVLTGAAAPLVAPRGAGPGLSVLATAGWVPFWTPAAAPARWHDADRAVASAVRWHAGGEGLRWGELELAGPGEAWRTRAVIAELDPARLQLELANGVGPGGFAPFWSVDHVPSDAVVALNAGQFDGAAVWGWVVHDGEEYRAPGRGPLSTAVVITPAGSVLFENDSAVTAQRSAGTARHPAGVREGFQSYPTLLEGDGRVPEGLLRPGFPIDLGHRDSRLALGQLRDGRLVVVLTRFDGLGPALGGIPFGLTIPEMAGLMGALGCRRAVALDGGVSAQLLVRDSADAHIWRGLRRVPLALIARPNPVRRASFP